VALAQCVFTVLCLGLLRQGGKLDFPRISLVNAKLVMPLPLIQVFNVGCGLVGTKMVSVPMFAVLRRASIPMTLLAEIFILHSTVNQGIIFSVALLVLGALVAAGDDLAFNFYGYAAILNSALATTAYGTVSKVKLSGPLKRTKWELLFYNSIVSIPLLAAVMWYREEMGDILAFEHWTNPLFLFSMGLSTCMGFLLNFAILYNTQINGPLTTTITGSAKNVITTYMGIFGLGGDYVYTFANFAGLNISMVGAMVYSYFKFKQQS